MTKKEKVSEVLVIAGILALAYYKYSKMTSEDKEAIAADIKEIGVNVLKELIPAQIKSFLPSQI